MFANYRGFTVRQMCYLFSRLLLHVHKYTYSKDDHVFFSMSYVSYVKSISKLLSLASCLRLARAPGLMFHLSRVERKYLANQMSITNYEGLNKFKAMYCMARHYGKRIIFLKISSVILYPDPSYQNKCGFQQICL
jgi:hypothetical protein